MEGFDVRLSAFGLKMLEDADCTELGVRLADFAFGLQGIGFRV